MLFYDFEVFSQDWLVVIKDTDTRSTNKILNDPDALREIYEKNKNNIWVGYNSRSYDQYILKGILLGMDPKKINDHIIVKNLGGWQYSRAFNQIQFYNFDIMTDKFKGLKQLEGFMGNDIRETTVNFNIDRKLTPKEIEETFFYCNHDVEQTMKVFINRKEEFDSQMNLIKTFKLPLKYINKTKAQLSAIILEADKREHDDEFEITIVDTLKVEKYKSIVNWYRNPVNLDYKKKLEIEVADVIHLFGWGGLHGARVKYQDEGIFINSDVTSFYPSLMIEYGFLSRNVRHAEKFKEIYDIRVELKKEGKKKEQAPYKIVLNSTYGASKDKYNNLFDPLQANNVCINGQLLLLDLIEHVTDKIPGAKLIQSNTDGIMFKLPNEETIDIYKDVCKEWETRTRMGLEHDLIKKVIQKDVNNYIIVMDNGKIKSKGAYVKSLNSLDYDLPIVNKALMEYFISGIPVEETINNCNDLIEFQKVVKVSSKYKCSLYGDQVLNENILRVFASRSRRDPGVYKLKKYKDTKDKIGGTPERCFIENGDIKGIKVPRKLDKQWYIDTAKKRIKDFVGEV
ncbi:DNA polymerase [Clostridium paraputrificum]|uniref:DNA polymerase n=1 Tax=Clostridium paraputrificum TaxID=29363 RepID=UPI0006C1C39B|nr:DNA polymerase [Clostridium paraputrificum]CUO59992.1 phage DNA polymerase [Clostridium paraputrificum]